MFPSQLTYVCFCLFVTFFLLYISFDALLLQPITLPVASFAGKFSEQSLEKGLFGSNSRNVRHG